MNMDTFSSTHEVLGLTYVQCHFLLMPLSIGRVPQFLQLGILIRLPQPFKRQIRYFWGYRNHMVADAQEELPLRDVTHPPETSEMHQAISMFQNVPENNVAFSLNQYGLKVPC